MKKILLIFTFLNVLFLAFCEVSINETKISKDNYERLAKCFKPEEFLEKANGFVKNQDEILQSQNDFELVSSLAENASVYKFLYNIFKQQKQLENQENQKKNQESESEEKPSLDLNAEILNVQNEFYKTIENYNSLLEERFANQEKYVEYVFLDSLSEWEEQIFSDIKEQVKGGFLITESFDKVPEYSLNEIYSAYKENEISAREKWEGKQVRITAMVYSIYKMDMNVVFCISSTEKNEVPVIRMNSGNQVFANFYFNSENIEKLKKIKKKSQITVVGTVKQDIARRPGFVDCKIVE